MRNNHLGRIILFGTFLLSCLMIIQIYWFKRAFDVAEKQFDHSVQVALKKVADSVAAHAEVKKLSSNFFLVSTNCSLNDDALDSLLKNQFSLRSIHLDYELGIYNAEDDTLVYGNYIEASGKKWIESHQQKLQSAEGRMENFAVYFPTKRTFMFAQLDVWIFSTVLLMLMMGFFAYAIASLLKERRFAELKSDFINNMTHEFKTPVTNIHIAGEILRKKIADDSTSKVYIDILLKENQRLRSKIDQVLLGSSLEHNDKATWEHMDLHKLLRDCGEIFHLKLSERNGKIDFDFLATEPMIVGDKDLLSQAFQNIIDNAEKYCADSPRIVVRTRDHSKGVEIDIIDNGIGIDPEYKAKVFEKFFRIRQGDVHNVKGFGLGLSFVRGVIENHKGRILLSSELDRGTEVNVLLPRR
jgi:two-component system, OmpR family, phosphate regulon sensor histidine kinase PhoR